MSAPAAASAHHPGKAGLDIDCASIPLKVSCKGHQYASAEGVKNLVAYRGKSVFVTTEREAAHMDQGLLIDPDDPAGAKRLPWKAVKLTDLVLMKCEMPVENGEGTTTQYQAYWRRCTEDAAHDDRYGLRLLKLSALKQILGNLGASANGVFVLSGSPDLTERRQHLFDGLDDAETKLWLEFIQLCEQKNFASGLSINFLDALKHLESVGLVAPFKLRQQVEPDWVPMRPRGEFDSAVTPIRRPKVSKTSAITTVPSDEVLVPAPTNVFPLLNGGQDNVSILHGMPKDAHKHVTDKMIMVTARTESLKAMKRKRDEDGGDTTEMISKKELRSFQDRVNIKEVPGGLTVFSFSGTPGDLRIADDKDGVFFVFHGSSPPCLGGPSRNHDDSASLFDIEDVDDVAAER